MFQLAVAYDHPARVILEAGVFDNNFRITAFMTLTKEQRRGHIDKFARINCSTEPVFLRYSHKFAALRFSGSGIIKVISSMRNITRFQVDEGGIFAQIPLGRYCDQRIFKRVFIGKTVFVKAILMSIPFDVLECRIVYNDSGVIPCICFARKQEIAGMPVNHTIRNGDLMIVSVPIAISIYKCTAAIHDAAMLE